ncbi:MAG TPA: ABC transporter permease [Terriglobales bacterium]|nr:ABC transporter permease [Terriglobales bacterium]
MNHAESWRVALDALRADKVKAALTMIGVILGSACIVMVVTVALTGKRYIMAQIEGVGSNLVYAYLVAGGSGQSTPLADQISVQDMQAIRNTIPQVKRVAGTNDQLLSMVINGKEHAVSLIGVTEDFQDIRNLEVLKGRYFDPVDMESYSKACLISEQLAKFYPQNPVGTSIKVGDLNFTIIGVFRERVATFGQSEITSESVLVPIPILKFYMQDAFIRTMYVQAAQPEDVPHVTQQVRDILRARHRSSATYVVENLTSLLQAAGKISLSLTLVLLFVALIALTISGVGIMNIMLVTVTERTREIGVRMAVGARRREIQYQFLLEAIMISGTGAIIGILIATSIPVLIQPFLPGNLHVPISGISVMLAFLVTCSFGVVFGYLPANRAAGLQPREALHHE